MLKRTLVPALTFGAGLLLGASVTAIPAVPGQASTSAGQVTGIGGVFLKAGDPDALRDWYDRSLGLEAGPQGATFLWRTPGDPGRPGRTVWSVFPEDTDYFGPSDQQCMVNYIVDDLDAVLARLEARGVRPVKEPESYPYGRFAWVQDGEGHRIELWEPPREQP